ncbi:MAG: hypothetical protein ACO25O_01315 [Candidatus Limnocylindrus sp.]
MSASDVPQQDGRRRRILRAGIFAAIAILILGNVFAASISVNSGNPLTFGQGQASVTACDPDVAYSVGSGFMNGTFLVSEIVVSIDNTACNGKQLIIIPFTSVNSTSTNVLDVASITITGISDTTAFTIGTGSGASELDGTLSAADVSGVALEIKD